MYSVSLWKYTYSVLGLGLYLYFFPTFTFLGFATPSYVIFSLLHTGFKPPGKPSIPTRCDSTEDKSEKTSFSFFSDPYLTSKLFEWPNKYIKSHYIRLFTQSTIYARDAKLSSHIQPHIDYCNLKWNYMINMYNYRKSSGSALPCTVMTKYRFCSFKENFFFSCFSVNRP